MYIYREKYNKEQFVLATNLNIVLTTLNLKKN